MHAFVRQREFSSLDRVCIACSAVKITPQIELKFTKISSW